MTPLHRALIPGYVLLGLAVAFLGWRIVGTNMAELILETDQEDAAAKALSWDRTNPAALYAEAIRNSMNDAPQALNLLLASVRHNPTDGPAYVAIAMQKEKEGDLGGAERALQAAVQLAPRRIDVQLAMANFFFRRGDVSNAIKHLDVALSLDPALHSKAFPELLMLAENPAVREAAFATLLKQPVIWWPQFFGYAASKAENVDTLRALFEMQAEGPNVITPSEMRAYLQRLQHQNMWIESYFVWLNHLSKKGLNAIGNLFNGGFEEPISNLGFDWLITPTPQVIIDTAPAAGAVGQRALRVVFRGPRIQFQHIKQFVMLDPGPHILRGRVRPDKLEAAEGLRWAIYCLGNASPLASSERFSGTDHWQYFSVQFSIPSQSCQVQMLRLELSGRSALDFEAKGAIWFDDMTITRETAIQ